MTAMLQRSQALFMVEEWRGANCNDIRLCFAQHFVEIFKDGDGRMLPQKALSGSGVRIASTDQRNFFSKRFEGRKVDVAGDRSESRDSEASHNDVALVTKFSIRDATGMREENRLSTSDIVGRISGLAIPGERM